MQFEYKRVFIKGLGEATTRRLNFYLREKIGSDNYQNNHTKG